MHVVVAVEAFLAHRRVTCAPRTMERYAADAQVWLNWRTQGGYGPLLADVTIDELRAFLAERAGRCAAWTVRSERRTLQGMWNYLEHEADAAGTPLLSPTQRSFFRNNRLPNPRISTRERPALQPEQLEALLDAVGDATDTDEECARNRAIVLLLWESGLRVHELAALTDEAMAFAERTARIVGKGDRHDVVFWGPRTAAALAHYVRVRTGSPGGPLFRGLNSRNAGQAATANLIRLCIKRIARRAGVALPKGSPCHCFRHGFARELRKRGLSRDQVGELLRDRTPKVVDTYLGLDVAPRRALHQQAFGV